MKKQYIFTKDTSFTHLKDEMYHSATEHILQEEETKKLYHHVVSYGTWFDISYESVFISHLLRRAGVTGFSKSYIANDCNISLPWYPSQHQKTTKTVVELPESIKLEQFEFGKEEESFIKPHFKQTFLGKTLKIKKEGLVYNYDAKQLLEQLFGATPYQLGYFKKQEEVYPFYTILLSSQIFDKQHKKQFIKMLSLLNIKEHFEVFSVLKRFTKINIKQEAAIFQQETGKGCPQLYKELAYKQRILRMFLLTKQLEMPNKKTL